MLVSCDWGNWNLFPSKDSVCEFKEDQATGDIEDLEVAIHLTSNPATMVIVFNKIHNEEKNKSAKVLKWEESLRSMVLIRNEIPGL